MLLFGVGYQLDAPSEGGARAVAPVLAKKTTNQEIALFTGRTIVNSMESENATAYALEYRRGLGPYWDATLGWLHEGGNDNIRRDGITAQLWLVRPFFDNRIAFGAGAGLYFVVNQDTHTPEGRDDERTAGILTLTASYRFDARWLARLSWNRIVTRYDRDTDVLLVGAGLGFRSKESDS